MNDSHAGAWKSSSVVSSAGHRAPSPYDNPTQEIPESVVDGPTPDDHVDDKAPAGRSAATRGTDDTATFAGIPAATNAPGEPSRSRFDPGYGRGTIDPGLLLLRLVVGGTFVLTGLQKLTGWWGGTGVEGTRHLLDQEGWKQAKPAGALDTAGELGGGVLVILGLLTPIAAAALLAVAVDAWLTLQDRQHGLVFNIHSGAILLVIGGMAAAALLLTGPGRIAADVNRGWSTRPRAGSLSILMIAVVAAVVVWVLLHGGNPFHG